ncbi:MAG: hypothetical protein EOO93_10015, partial [Pedobacter sp.]
MLIPNSRDSMMSFYKNKIGGQNPFIAKTKIMFENKERTDINELGEFGLIKHLTTNFKIRN